MFVVINVFSVNMIGKTELQSIKKAVKHRLKWKKKKANDWMWQSHGET